MYICRMYLGASQYIANWLSGRTPGRTTSAVCFSLPISFLWENDKVKINPFNHVVKNHSWWFGPCSHFFFLRNHDGSNYPFTDDVKNHVCLVSPAQSKKNPKVSAKTVVVPEHARPINRRDKILFCPGHNWDKTDFSQVIGTKQWFLIFVPARDKRKQNE